MQTIEVLKPITQEGILALLSACDRKQAEAAIAKKDSWQPQDYEQLKGCQPTEFFLMVDDPDLIDAAKYPDGFWYHGEIWCPVVQVEDGAVGIGYTGIFDCGDLYEEGNFFWGVEEAQSLYPSMQALLAGLAEEVAGLTTDGTTEYHQWVQGTGRDPYGNRAY